MNWRFIARSAAAALTALVLALVLAHPAAQAQRLPTNVLVRGAAMRALERLYEPGVEIITQGSWNKASGYNDPRFQQMIGGASDHDMRVFMPSPAGQTAAEAAAFRERATRVWRRYRDLVDEELNRLVQAGVLRAEELNVVRRSINVYPPEQLMAGVNSSENAIARFQELRTRPNLIDASDDAARGAYGEMQKFARQEFETGERVRVITQSGGRARFTAMSDLNHMIEGFGARRPVGLAFAATNNLDDALHALEANARNLKDVAKYTDRASRYMAEARDKLRLNPPRAGTAPAGAADRLRMPLPQDDSAFGRLSKKLTDMKDRFDAAEPKLGVADTISGNRVPRAKTAEEIATQNQILAEMQSMGDEIRQALRVATEESLILQNMARAIEEGQPVVARFYRLLMSGSGKWVGTLASMRDQMASINERAKKIGYLNIVSALYEFYSFPWNYEKEGTTMASVRLAKGLATLAVPELAIGELLGLIATGIAEYAVDEVKAFGYSVVASRQDCLDLLAGHYSVYGREVQALGVGTKACHASPSLRQLACDVYDTGDLRGTIARGARPDARSIPSQLRGMIECHAENASYRSDETKSSDKGVQDFIVNRCLQDVLPKWLQERDVVLGEISMIADAIANATLATSFDPEQAIIRDPAKGTTVTVTASIEPSYQDAIELMKGDVAKGGLQCAGSKVAKPFVYERVVWRQDGKEVDSGTRVGSRPFEFPKAGSSTICVDWELEFGVIGAPTVLTPEEMAGKIRKTACTTIDAMVDVGVEKVTAKITGPKKAAAPDKAETGKALSFAVDLATKRDPKQFRLAWNFADGNLQTQADAPEPKVIWYRPGRYEITLDVFDGSDFGTVSEIKSKPIAQAKHTVTVESSLADARNDGKVTIAVTGPAEIKVGGSADLSASVQAPEHLKAKIRQVYWYLWRMGGPDEDPSEIGFQGYELLGEGPTLRWTPPSAGDFTILARVMGESIAGDVAGTSHRLHVTCREEGGNTVCQGPKTAPRKLGVIVLPDRRNVATGDQVLVNAIASGGKPPFSFAWSPAVDGEGPAVVYRPTAAAPTLTVTATDASGVIAKETVTFGVDRALPLLEGLAATETFGSAKPVSVALDGGRSVIWQSSPSLGFDKPESGDGRGSVSFTRLGRVKVWADVMVTKDGAPSKLGSTDQVEVDVVAPGSRVAFEPPTQRPGAEVTARVELAPPPDPALVYYVWTQPATTQRDEVTPGTIRFKAGDKPTAIEVEVRAKASDQTVAQLSARFDPTGASTTGGGSADPASAGPSKAKQAAELLAKAKAAVAAGQLDEGIAGAADAVKTAPSLAEAATLGAQWQAERQAVSRQVAASDAALAAGRIADAKKQLAVAQAAHPKYRPVVEAAQRIAQREAERARQVQSLVAAAQAALAKGDVDAAASSAQQAAQLDPAAAAQVVNQVSYEAKKQGWAAVNDRDFARAIPRLELATRFAPADADARDRLAQAKRFAATWPQVEAKAREFDALVAALKPFSAYEAMLQMQNLQHDMPSGMGNPLSRRVMEASSRALAEYNVFWQAKTDEHRRTFVEQDWDAMLKNARETLARELSPASVNEARSRLAFAEQQLAGQKEALDYAAQIRSALSAGQLGDPQRVLGELRTRAGRFKAQDARGQPIRDTIAALERHQRVLAARGYAAVAFASGDRMLAAYDYVTAAGEYAAGLKALRENGDPADPDIAKYERKRQDADARARRIATLMPRIAPIAMDPNLPPKATLEQAFGEADEVVRLQPTNTDAQIYRNRIADKLKQLDAQAQSRASAAASWNEGRRLYEGGDALGGLAKFKESLRAWPDEANQRYVADLEARIAQARAAAAALWNEGRALYDAGRPREALAKFKDSLRAWPDAANARYVEQLEAALAAQAAAQAAAPRPVGPAPVVPPVAVPAGAAPPSAPPPVAAPAGATPQGSPAGQAAPGSADAGFFLVDLTPVGGKKSAARTVKGLRVDDGSWVRLKATHEKRLVLDVPLVQRVGASAIAVVSNLDNAHYLKDGFPTTLLTVHTTAGERTFEFRAGVHSSEWNRSETGGADHAYPKATAIGDARWMAVFTLPAGTVVTGLRFDHRDPDPKLYHMGAAPGFCLRGITLVTGASLSAEAAAAAAASMAGAGAGPSPSGTAAVAPPGAAPVAATGGLLAHYPLDGNAQDASGRGLHGKVTGAQPTTDRAGRAGGAMLFDGRAFIELPLDVNPSAVPRLTFTAWVRADAPAPIQQVMSHDDGGFDRSLGIDGRGGGAGWSLFAGTSGVVGFRPAQKGQWVFVAAVWDQPAGKVRLQVDDWVVERPGSLGGGGRTLNLGRNPGYGEHFVGAIDDVRLYGDALGASQLAHVRAGAAPAAGTAPAPAAAAPAASGNVVFDNGNIGGVDNAPTRPTTFTLPAARTITMIRTYHWNGGRGAAPGSIGLRDAAGRTYGPWPVTATPGQGGAPNVNWVARPNAPLPPGTYTVLDSDPSTWSQNGESGGAGFVRVESAP